MTLRRGFYAEAERRAREQRELLGVAESQPVNPFALLELHNITVRSPDEIRALGSISDRALRALHEHASAWSSLTVRTRTGVVVVHNPRHDLVRQNHTLTHELAHVLLGHSPGALQTVGGCVMRDFDELQEEEAHWLGDTILAPRAALTRGARRGLDTTQIAAWLGCSTQVVTYRANALRTSDTSFG